MNYEIKHHVKRCGIETYEKNICQIIIQNYSI